MSGQNPDAELIALCAQLIELDREESAIIASVGKRYDPVTEAACEAAKEPLIEELDRVIERVAALRATTPAGHQARARMILFCYRDLLHQGGQDTTMVAALVRDLADPQQPGRLVDQAELEKRVDQLQDIVLSMDAAAFEDLLLVARRFRRSRSD